MFVDYGYCAIRVCSPAARTAWSVAGKTNAEVAVPAAQRVDVDGCGEVGGCLCVHALCLAPLSSARFRILSSPALSCFLSKQSQLMRFAAVSSHISVLLSRAFMMCLQMSLYRS